MPSRIRFVAFESGEHHRMPVILLPSAWEEWLNPETPVGVLQDMLHPTPNEWLEIIAGGPSQFSVG